MGISTDELKMDSLSDPLVGLGLQYVDMCEPEKDVSLTLMKNDSRMYPAKRGSQEVSVDNQSGHFNSEPKGVRNVVDRKRKMAERKRKRMESLLNAGKTIPMKKITTLFAKHNAVQTNSLYPSVFRFLEPLFQVAEESFETILDEALDEYGTDLLARGTKLLAGA